MLTRTGKLTLASLLIAGVLFPAIALAQVSSAALAAILSSILSWLQGTLYNFLYQGIVWGIANLMAQITADTFGTMNAMQQQLAAQLHGIAQQTAIMTDHRNQMEFGEIATITASNGTRIGVNAIPPSGCRQRQLGATLERSYNPRRDRRYAWGEHNARWNSNPTARITDSYRYIEDFREAKADGRTDLSWISTDWLPPEKVEKGREAIERITNPNPLPATAGPGGPATVEFQMYKELHDQQMLVVQSALNQVLDLKAPLTDEQGNIVGDGHSVLSTIGEWSKFTVADALYPERLQAKTQAGLAREQTIIQAAQLYVASEQLKATTHTNALLAILALNSVNTTARQDAKAAQERAVSSNVK